MKASIYNSELEFISKCVLDYENLETGGDLFGYWDKNGNPVIKYVTGPGKDAERTTSSFNQDIPYLHKCVQYLHKNHALEQIGSWHSHHTMNLPHPSGGDATTVKNSLDSFPNGKFLLIICNILSSKNKEVGINGFVFSKGNRDFNEVKWITLLAKENPERKHIEADKEARFITNPKTKKAFPIFQREYSNECTTVYQNVQQPEKPTFSPDYYFNTQEGQGFLRNELEKLKSHQDISNVEMILEKDNTISITFDWGEKEYIVNYPLDFSKDNPKPIIKEKNVTQQNVKSEKEQKEYIIVEYAFREVYDIINLLSNCRNKCLNFRIYGLDF